MRIKLLETLIHLITQIIINVKIYRRIINAFLILHHEFVYYILTIYCTTLTFLRMQIQRFCLKQLIIFFI